MKLLGPTLRDLSPRHLEIYWRYQVVRTAVDFGAALCFVIGSAFFFFASMTRAADWLFLVGSTASRVRVPRRRFRIVAAEGEAKMC